MLKTVSRSVEIMFIFDLVILTLSTLFCYDYLNLPDTNKLLACSLIIITGLISLFLKGNYKIREFNLTFWNFFRLLEGVIFAHIPFVILMFFYISKLLLVKYTIYDIFIVYTALCLYRVCFHFYLFKFKKNKNILILGTDKRARVIADEIQGKYALRMNVAGFVQDNDSEEEFIADEKIPVYRSTEHLDSIIRDNKIDIIVIAQPTELLLTVPFGVDVYKMPDFYEMVTGKYYIDEKTMTELYYRFMKYHSYAYDFLKRLYDIIAALIILIVTLPITGFIAIRVKLTDGGSPIYTQTRVGKGGKTFECYKLRTMYINDYVPKDSDDVKYAESVKSDDRIIPFCRFVRKARFDEIPQMINILKGEMSIVGPRAEWEDEVEIFKKQIPYYSCRMWVNTGWTGWSHINMDPVFTVDEEKERLEHDLYYIKHQNVLWEIGILIKAVFLAIGGRHK